MIMWNWFDTDCKNEWAIFTRLISLTGPFCHLLVLMQTVLLIPLAILHAGGKVGGGASYLLWQSIAEQFLWIKGCWQMRPDAIKCNQNLCHFFRWPSSDLCDNFIIRVTNFSERCGWQQEVMNAFSLLTEEVGISDWDIIELLILIR